MSSEKLPPSIMGLFSDEIFPDFELADEELIEFKEEVLRVADSPSELTKELGLYKKYTKRIKNYSLFQVISELFGERSFNNKSVRIFARIVRSAYNYVKGKKLPEPAAKEQLIKLLSLQDADSFVSVFKNLGFSDGELFLIKQYSLNPSLVEKIKYSHMMRDKYTDEQNKLLKKIRIVSWGISRKLISLIEMKKADEISTGSTPEADEYLSEIPHEAEWMDKYAGRTKKAYKEVTKDFFVFNKIKSIDDLQNVGTEQVQSYKEVLGSRNTSVNTIERNLSALSSMFNHLINQKVFLRENPTEQVKRPEINRYVPKNSALLREDVERILNSPDTTTLKGSRDKAVLALLFFTGCQISQVCNLKIKNYRDAENGDSEIVIFSPKRTRTVKVSAELKSAIDHYLKLSKHGNEPDSPLILGVKQKEGMLKKPLDKRQVDRIFKEHIEKAGLSVKEISAQSARITYFTNQKSLI